MTLVNSPQTPPDLQALSDRLTALESLLGLFGAATPAAAGTNGLVQGAGINQQAHLLRGDRTWQFPNFVGLSNTQTVEGVKTFAAPIVITNTTQSTSSTTGSFVANGGVAVGGFTTLGERSSSVKTVVIEGITAATQGGLVTVAHGLVGDKIIGVQVLVRYTTNSAVSPSFDATSGFNYSWAYEGNLFYLYNVTSNSVQILSKPFAALLTYIA